MQEEKGDARGGSGREAVGCDRGGDGACVRVQAPTSVGGWDYLRICCPQVKFMSCAATLGCSERGSRHPCWITHFLYIENLGDRSSHISNTCMFCLCSPSTRLAKRMMMMTVIPAHLQPRLRHTRHLQRCRCHETMSLPAHKCHETTLLSCHQLLAAQLRSFLGRADVHRPGAATLI